MRRTWVIGLSAILIALAGCTEPAEVDLSQPELLYEGPVGWSPELSPDGAYLAVPGGTIFGDDEAVDILLLDLETGGITNLTQYNPLDGIIQDALYPRWSPDGEYIYFIEYYCDFTDDGDFCINRVPSTGGDIESLLTFTEASCLAINRDGTELAFRYEDENRELRIGRYIFTTGKLTDILGGDGLNVVSLAYTPDDARLMASIVRDIDTPYRTDVVLFPENGDAPEEFDCRFDWEPSRISFSPDGRTCLFQCDKNLFTVPIEGGEGTYIRPDVEGDISRGAWFSDGDIYFVLDGDEVWRYKPDM